MNNSAIHDKIKSLLRNEAEPTLLIHSDLMHGFQLPFTSRNEFLAANYNELCKLNDNIKIWMPAFNYDFCRGLTFDAGTAKSQVGALSEYFRNHAAGWRTAIPVFSFCGTGIEPAIKSEGMIDPFGTESAFGLLYKKKAWLMHYGSALGASTVLHYAERLSHRLAYRYDKIFNGEVIDSKNVPHNISLQYHVRPMGRYLEYDWTKIERDLVEGDVLTEFQEGRTRILLCKINEIVDFWINKMITDPFYLLDAESRRWIIPHVTKLGRPFVITDFESL